MSDRLTADVSVSNRPATCVSPAQRYYRGKSDIDTSFSLAHIVPSSTMLFCVKKCLHYFLLKHLLFSFFQYTLSLLLLPTRQLSTACDHLRRQGIEQLNQVNKRINYICLFKEK